MRANVQQHSWVGLASFTQLIDKISQGLARDGHDALGRIYEKANLGGPQSEAARCTAILSL